MSDNQNEIINSPPPKKERSRFFWKNIGIIISGVAAAILIAMIVLVSYSLLMVNKHLAVSLADLTDRFNATSETIIQAQKSSQTAEQAIEKTNDILKAQSDEIAEIQKVNRKSRDDFAVQEAFYLIRMANNHLQYENNTSVALKLLQSADQDLTTISDPKVYSVRKALAADVVALQSAPQVDLTGVYVRLAALNEQINKLHLITQLLNLSPEAAANANNPKLSWWRRGLSSLEVALQRIVIVRRNMPNEPPFIAPDQQMFLYQNLHVELEKAQWGLLHRDSNVYRLSLSQAINWINLYAVADSSVTKQMLQNLQQLQQIEVHPAVPNLINSLQALQTYSSATGKE